MMDASRTSVGTYQQLQPAPSHAQHVQDMRITDIPIAQHQKKVERMITALPNRAICVLYKALQTCHGNLDLAVDMIIHQEEHNRDRGVSGTTVSDLEGNAATCARFKISDSRAADLSPRM